MWNYKALGWFTRFVPPGRTDLHDYYIATLGLPFIRKGSKQHVDFLWAGESIVHQLIYEGTMTQADPADADPSTAPLVPVYRTATLDSLIAALKAKNVTVGAVHEGAFGREAHILDPSGSLVGLREAPFSSPFLHDRIAAYRRERGEAFNPGCDSMPAAMQELGWLVRRVVDLAAMESFYRDTLGFPLIARAYGRVLFDLGDNSVLELAGGGAAKSPPANRSELSALFVMRVDDLRQFRQSMHAHNVTVVHEILEWPRGLLTYVADPEGNLIGVEERFHPKRYAPRLVPFPEDLEAQRRWVEWNASGAPKIDRFSIAAPAASEGGAGGASSGVC